jgi:uncharacterized membrane protein YphA (DoxX/SURF4 family)
MAPTIIRITVGTLFIILGYEKYTIHKNKLADFLNSIRINPAKTVVQFLGGVEIVIGILLIVGAITQIAALIALIISLVSFVLALKEPDLNLRKPTVYLLTMAICFSLLLTGAGFLAIDLPL